MSRTTAMCGYFPSFSEGLSLREDTNHHEHTDVPEFPFLFGGTFIEAVSSSKGSTPP